MKGRERRLDHPPSPLLDSSLALFLRMLLFLLLHPYTPLSLQKVYYSSLVFFLSLSAQLLLHTSPSATLSLVGAETS